MMLCMVMTFKHNVCLGQSNIVVLSNGGIVALSSHGSFVVLRRAAGP